MALMSVKNLIYNKLARENIFSYYYEFYLVSKTLTVKGFEKFLVKNPKGLQRKFYLVSDSKKDFYMETF